MTSSGEYYVTQDALNVYVFDRVDKKIIIVRVGSDMNMDMIDRKFTSIQYKE